MCGGCRGRFDPRDWEETEEAMDAALEDVNSLGDCDNGSRSDRGIHSLAASPGAAAYEQGRPFDVQVGGEGSL